MTTGEEVSTPPRSNKKEQDASISTFLYSSTTLVVTLIRIGLLIPPDFKWNPIPPPQGTIGWLLHSVDMAPFWVSTLARPHETWTHVAEAQAVRQTLGSPDQFRDAYRGSTIHLPPLVLAVLEPFHNTLSEPWRSFVVGTLGHLVDLAIALQLLQLGKRVLEEFRDPWEDDLQPSIPESLRAELQQAIPLGPEEIVFTNELPARKDLAEKKEKEEEKEKEETGNSPPKEEEEPQKEETKKEIKDNYKPPVAWHEFPLLAAQLYYYSPFTMLATGLGTTHHSFQNLWVLCLLCALNYTCQNNPPLSAFCLALGSYSEPHYFVYLVPLGLWLQRQKKSLVSLLLFFLFWTLYLQGMTLLLVGASQYNNVFYSSYGHVFRWKSLHPNFSVLWYLNMELFEQYRYYFTHLIGGLPYTMPLPLTIRLWRYPMVLTTIFWMLWTLIRPTTTLVDANIALCLAVLCPRSLARMRVPTTMIPIFSLPIPVSLYVVTLWMWLEPNNGEANFTFFQCLAYLAFLATVFLEFSGASLRRDKVLRLTEKELGKQRRAKAKEEKESKEGSKED